jgi:hypothetical protein
MNTFSPNDDQNALLANCVDGVLKLSNAMFAQLPPGAQTALNTAVFAGARVLLTVELNPCPAVYCTVEYGGQTVQLFEVQLANDGQPETQH